MYAQIKKGEGSKFLEICRQIEVEKMTTSGRDVSKNWEKLPTSFIDGLLPQKSILA